jgi:putative spermidine/putrescine transport system ATP-binding protein
VIAPWAPDFAGGGWRRSLSLTGVADVTLSGVDKQFGAVSAVRDCTLSVRSGEFFTLLGPSGSGKTTILMMVAGFEYPTRGHITLDGRDITSLPANRRDVGMVFQSYALFPHLTVFDNVAFPLSVRHVPKSEIRERVMRALTLVHLPAYVDRLPRQLSGGEQQRVALARAIVFSPRILLMDEPLGALDKKLRTEMQVEIRRLQRELGITTIYVTHDQEEALSMSDRIGIMRAGRLEQMGTPRELYSAPTSAFVATFLGNANFVDGIVVESRGTAVVVALAGGPTVSVPGSYPRGAALTLMVRPEHLAVTGDPPAPHDGATSVAAEVQETVYLGAAVQYRLGALGTTFIAYMSGMRTYFAEHDKVWLQWQRHDLRVISPNASPNEEERR